MPHILKRIQLTCDDPWIYVYMAEPSDFPFACISPSQEKIDDVNLIEFDILSGPI
jgi:hypothetical protein